MRFSLNCNGLRIQIIFLPVNDIFIKSLQNDIITKAA